MTVKLVKFIALAVAVAPLVGCGEFTREGRSPMVLVVDRLETGDDENTLRSDVVTDEGSIFNDNARVGLRLISKDPGAPGIPAPTSTLNAVTVTRYRVTYRRTDGRNTEGVDVPYAFDSAMTVTIPAGDQTVEGTFQIVRHSAKEEAPLKALSFNRSIISTIATVTFYGHDQAGNEISAQASMGIDFGNFADDSD